MNQERALKVAMVLVGLFFVAGVYPVTDSLWHQNQSMYTFDIIGQAELYPPIYPLSWSPLGPTAPATEPLKVVFN